ncbi:MAG: hypothetical protein NXI31_01280 [bacterium]|nr:hypothetical protein [bacterium]
MMPPRFRAAGLPAAVSALVFSCALTAQSTGARACTSDWLPGFGLAGLGASPTASVRWDPDGAGPLGEHVVLGGRFKIAGDTSAQGVAMVDPVTGEWTALATRFEGSITSFAVVGSDLIVAGAFSGVDGVLVRNIARFDGANWSSLGSGLGQLVNDLAVAANGDLYAGGVFTSAGSVTALRIARWDGSAWHGVGGGVNGSVEGVAVLPNGDVTVIGAMTSAGNGGVAVNRAARWNGTAWSAMGSGPNLFLMSDLFVDSAGELYAVGTGSAVQRWNGTSWVGLSVLPGSIETIGQLSNGDLIAGGLFTTAGPNDGYLARWNGTSWQTLAGPDNTVRTLQVLAGDRVVIGGRFREADGRPAVHTALWTASGSYPLASGMDGNVVAMHVLQNGDLVGGGGFRIIDGVAAAGVARFDGSRWHPYRGGTNGAVRAITVMPNGDLIVGGEFTEVDGIPAAHVARFDGSRWYSLGTGMNDNIWALTVTPAGDIVAGGQFTTAGGVSCDHVARWDGTAWQPMGGGMDGFVFALAVTPTGQLVAGGRFVTASGSQALRVATWDGAAWSGIGGGLGSVNPFETVYALDWLDGRLIAGGDFRLAPVVNAGGMAEWNGQSWVALGGGLAGTAGTVYTLGELPNGDIVIGGALRSTPPLPDDRLLRWDGSSWQAIGGSLDNVPWAIAMHGADTLAVGGTFRNVDGMVSAGFARYRTSCPGTVTEQLMPCVGPAGPLALAASAGPWIGTTIELAATGFAAQSFGAALIGLTSPGTPLGLLHPTALPNCRLLASSESVSFVVPSAGAAAIPFTVPNDPVFGGITLHAQFLQAGLVGGAVQTLSGSNGLELAIGVF